MSSCDGTTAYHSLWSEDKQNTSTLHSVQLEWKKLTAKLSQLQEKLSELNTVVSPAPWYWAGER